MAQKASMENHPHALALLQVATHDPAVVVEALHCPRHLSERPLEALRRGGGRGGPPRVREQHLLVLASRAPLPFLSPCDAWRRLRGEGAV